MASELRIGIIGGSGLDDPEILEESEQISIETPFGPASDGIVRGKIHEVECVVLPRHGRKHLICPSAVNYQANIWALHSLGCSHVLATNAVGSLQDRMKPGDLVILDDFFDRTKSRRDSFYDGKHKSFHGVAHIAPTPPFCDATRNVLIEACQNARISMYKESKQTKKRCYHDKGIVCVIEGPRFSTKAESKLWHSLGFDVIGMTAFPECVLAKELGLCYASVAMVTDWDAWLDDKEQVDAHMVMDVFAENVGVVKQILIDAIKLIKEKDWTSIKLAHKENIAKAIMSS